MITWYVPCVPSNHITYYISHDITGYFTIRLPTLQHGQEPIECQLLTQGECLTPAGCFTPMANMNPHKVQQQKQLRNTWATRCRCQALLRSLKVCVNCCQVWRFDHVWPIGRDADATVLRSLDVHHLPSRPQHREVGQDTASRQSSDLLQLVRSFQLLSSFGHEAIAMPWTWAVQSRQARKNNLINVTDYTLSRGVGATFFWYHTYEIRYGQCMVSNLDIVKKKQPGFLTLELVPKKPSTIWQSWVSASSTVASKGLGNFRTEHICAESTPRSLEALMRLEKTWHKFRAKCIYRTSYLHTSPKKQRQIEAALPRNCNRHHGTCTCQDCGVSKGKAFKSDDEYGGTSMAWVWHYDIIRCWTSWGRAITTYKMLWLCLASSQLNVESNDSQRRSERNELLRRHLLQTTRAPRNGSPGVTGFQERQHVFNCNSWR